MGTRILGNPDIFCQFASGTESKAGRTARDPAVGGIAPPLPYVGAGFIPARSFVKHQVSLSFKPRPRIWLRRLSKKPGGSPPIVAREAFEMGRAMGCTAFHPSYDHPGHGQKPHGPACREKRRQARRFARGDFPTLPPYHQEQNHGQGARDRLGQKNADKKLEPEIVATPIFTRSSPHVRE